MISRAASDALTVLDKTDLLFSVHRSAHMDVLVGHRILRGMHPNAVRSSSIDFEASGVLSGWILEIQEGVNQGSYSIREVDGDTVFVQQVLPGNDPGPVRAVVRRPLPKAAQLTAAIVINQPVFNAGFSVTVTMDVSVV